MSLQRVSIAMLLINLFFIWFLLII